jgi:hypothetical protein
MAFGESVAGAGAVEVGEYVGGAPVQCPAERDELDECGGHAVADGVDELLHQRPATAAVGFAVGGDHAPVDPLARFDLDVFVGRKQVGRPLGLLAGE